MNQTTYFECKCSFKTKVSFKKPHIVEPSIVNMECCECKSRYTLKFKKHRTEKDKVHVESRLYHVSPVLEALLKEEAEFNSEPLGDSAT